MERWYATLTIYGDVDALSGEQILSVAAAAARDGFNFDHSDTRLDTSDLVTGLSDALEARAPLELSYALAENGEFAETEPLLKDLGMSFLRCSSSEEHGEESVLCVGGGEPVLLKAGQASAKTNGLTLSGKPERLAALLERAAATSAHDDPDRPITLTITGELDSVWVETVADIGEASEDAKATFVSDGQLVDRTSFVGRLIDAAVAHRPLAVRASFEGSSEIERLLQGCGLDYMRDDGRITLIHRGSEAPIEAKPADLERARRWFLTGPEATIQEYRVHHGALVDLDRALASPGM